MDDYAIKVVELVRQAEKQERERAARIAESHPFSPNVGKAIAAEIRSGQYIYDGLHGEDLLNAVLERVRRNARDDITDD